MSRAGCLVTRHLRGSGAGPLEAGLRGGRGLEHGLEAQGCSCAAAPSPAPLRRLHAPPVRGRPRLRHTQHAVFFFSSGSPLFMSCCQHASKVAHVFASLRLRCTLGSRLTSLFRSSIQVMMRPARLPIVRFGPLIPTPWRAERNVLPRSASPSAVKENQRYSAPRFLRQTGDARPLSAARTRHAVQR